ncbi:hypothetical protein MMC20_005752 [Loxospora ochrophaea]|nr:hypothetical protein [Loxospora ochrophaea]
MEGHRGSGGAEALEYLNISASTLHTTTMRLPYVPNPPHDPSPTLSATVSRMTARRAPHPLQPLDLTLLHSPPVADGWNSFLGAIRTQTSLAAHLRELAICRVAALNGAEYEWMHHAPLAIEAGVTDDDMRAVREAPPGAWETVPHLGQDTAFGEEQLAVLHYTDRMTKDVRVEEGTFDRLKTCFTDQEIVEITATVAAYNCVSRFLVALDVGEMNGKTEGGVER